MWENFEPQYDKTTMSYVNINWEISEIMLFLKRLYQDILEPEDQIEFRLTISGCKGRRLYDNPNWAYDIFSSNACAEDVITIEETISVSTLITSWKELARKHAKRVYTIFGLGSITDETIEKKQSELLKLKLS